MGGKQMEGDNRERRKMAKEARDQDQKPSEVAATLGSSKQINSSDSADSHQQKLEMKREGKHASTNQEAMPEASTRSRDSHGAERDRYPRLQSD
jgi:hypothetical protein